MKGKSRKQILFIFMCIVGVSILIHLFSDLSWWSAFGIASGIHAFLDIQEDLRSLRGELKELSSYFSIADAELVRVSALATEHEEKFWDIQQEIIQMSQEIENIGYKDE